MNPSRFFFSTFLLAFGLSFSVFSQNNVRIAKDVKEKEESRQLALGGEREVTIYAGNADLDTNVKRLKNVVKLKPLYLQKNNPKNAKSNSQFKKNMSSRNDKIVVYQMMFHLWGNKNTTNKVNGSAAENGVTKFSDINAKALNELKKFGYTHLYMTGLLEHATMEDLTSLGIPKDNPEVVKGRCGSPFAVKDYYDVNPFFADKPENRLTEFQAMLDRVHAAGLKLIMDFVPNHVARYYHSDMKPKGVKDFGANDDINKAFDPNNNFYYIPNTHLQVPANIHPPVEPEHPYHELPAKVSGNDVFSATPSINDWYETVKLNYGVDYIAGRVNHFDPIPSTWSKMANILEYWTKKGVDGFRCDMAEMVPVEFWNYAIPNTKKKNKDLVFIAEVYNPLLYKTYINEGKFDYLYDKVGLYDGLKTLIKNDSGSTVEAITRVWQHESGDISEHMLRFLENHDEIRVNSDEFSYSQPFAAVPAMVVTATLHSGPIMIYFGQELGEKAKEVEGFQQSDNRTTMFDFWGVKTHQAWMNNGKFDGGGLNEEQKKLRAFYGDLLKFVHSSDAVQKGRFYDLQYVQEERYNRQKVYSYLRYSGTQKLLFVCNFDHFTNYEFNSIIPEGAWNAMGLKADGKYTFKEVYSGKSTQKVNANVGPTVRIAANSVKVFEILEK